MLTARQSLKVGPRLLLILTIRFDEEILFYLLYLDLYALPLLIC